MQTLSLLSAINTALDESMKNNNQIIILGQDVGVCGGVFRATDGLYTKYGKDRVIDMPLAENLIAGVALGLAADGLLPIAETVCRVYFSCIRSNR